MDVQQSKSARAKRPRGIEVRRDSKNVLRYRGMAFDKATGKRLRGSWTRSLAEAKSWRVDAQARLQAGTLTGHRGRELADACDDYIRRATAGHILNRGGDQYKPAVIRGLEQAFRIRVIPSLGSATRLGDIRRAQVQRAVDDWRAQGISASAVRNTFTALRALVRYAERRGEIAVNPTDGVELPRVTGRRERIAEPKEGIELLFALPAPERAIYATAMFAGLRLGELKALRWTDFGVDQKTIHVRWSWDPQAGRVRPKSQAGLRKVSVNQRLGGILRAHRDACPWSGNPEGLIFGRTASVPFSDTGVRGRACRRWEAAGLSPLGMHEARHTFASWCIGAGVNMKALSTMMGHSTITMTMDRYGHLMAGSEAEAAVLLDAYLDSHTRTG